MRLYSARANTNPAGKTIALVREVGDLIEIRWVEDWAMELALSHSQDYWLGHFAPGRTPAKSILDMLVQESRWSHLGG